jgi:hypothetical protein
MSVLSLIMTLLLLGLLLYVVEVLIPLDYRVRKIIEAVIIIGIIVYILQAFGLFSHHPVTL